MITTAMRQAVAALDLPFDLSDADIARQFNADGSAIVRPLRDGITVARGLATAAMASVSAANDTVAPAPAPVPAKAA